jgi:Peptidase S46
MKSLRRIVTYVALVTPALGGSVVADEGMWTFDKLPLRHLKEAYGFEPPPGWVEHLQSSAVRFNNGGSGSFVSADGLLMTNHHVGADTLQKISTKEKDYYKLGFYAKTNAEEVKAPDLELNVLIGIEDVTDLVNASVKPGMDDASANTARRGAMARIEKDSLDKTGLRSDVVTLYQGGKYALYTTKKYTDVRLVFAPEFDIAFFGGDPDNFEYPRYCLDICFFRAYEDGKPVKPKHYLAWSSSGSKEGELTFVAGHPGRTSRLLTMAHLEYVRDHSFPLGLARLHDREANLLEYGKLGPEQFRQSKEELFHIQNSRKAYEGGFKGLNDKALMTRKAEAEKALRARIEADPARKAAFAGAWDKIAASKKVASEILKPYRFLEGGFAFDSHLFDVARTLVRLAAEKPKPNADRLREYRESALESLEQELFSEAPTYPDFEKAKLARSLAFWKKLLSDDPMIERVLRGRSPEQAAADLVDGTKLASVPVRKALAEGGLKAIEASDDPMIKLALAVDADARALRKKVEDQVEAVDTVQYALIAKARFAELGESTYPDATFTLRLAFGTVKGLEIDGKTIPAYTTIGGAFDHAKAHGDQPPYQLPPSWPEARKERRLRLDTPFNFISTADIIGGNSGSPVVNRQNEVVGLIFDGNIDSLVLDFAYDDRLARAVSVDSRGILEALRSIYRVDGLVKELTGGK